MYVPAHFHENRIDVLRDLIRVSGFATLVSMTADGLIASHAPLMLEIVTRLTNRHETPRAQPWAVTDAPDDFVKGMLRGIVGIRLPIARLEGKVKMSQNRPAADQIGVVEGLRHDGRDDLAQAVLQATAG